MLVIAIVVLIGGVFYAISIAPEDQRLMIGLVVAVLTAAGYGVGMAITKPHTDERSYYPIAAALGGTMIAFGWISHKRKSWPKKDDK